ncbi:MAG: hypothetical protein OQK24_08030 [Magnetovibrio sp.]|nr:hypothetical protein [Magnetovibrio sp.]
MFAFLLIWALGIFAIATTGVFAYLLLRALARGFACVASVEPNPAVCG